MGTYLNPGNGRFQKALDTTKYYRDKSGLLKFTNGAMGTEQAYVCVSHPRRFGKSLAANMLAAYYGRGCDSSAQFDGLAISADPSYRLHLNRYDVIYLDISGIMDSVEPMHSVASVIRDIKSTLSDELAEAYPSVPVKDGVLPKYLERVYSETGTPFVFVMDEWDAPLREDGVQRGDQKEYLDFLSGLLKGKDYVGLCYMTGILPIKKFGTGSELNMFDEYTMLDAYPLQEFFGFTEDEVRGFCSEYGRSFDEMKSWYDGYALEGVSMYNPRSVVRSLEGNKICDYWTKTETYENLKSYITLNVDGVKDKVIALLSDEEVTINPDKFKNDLVSLESADEVLTLLVHLGYLSYDPESRAVKIPNREVRIHFENTVEDAGWTTDIAVFRNSLDIYSATLAGEEKKVAEHFDRIHESETSYLKYNNEDTLAHTISFAYQAVRLNYTVIRECPAGKGLADIAYLPIPGKSVPPMIVELKCNRSADVAIGQIKENWYAHIFKGYRPDSVVYLVGINYDKKSKKHDCRIEERRVEELLR